MEQKAKTKYKTNKKEEGRGVGVFGGGGGEERTASLRVQPCLNRPFQGACGVSAEGSGGVSPPDICVRCKAVPLALRN